MVTEKQVKEKLLSLYAQRDKFKLLVNDEKQKTIELKAAFLAVENYYTEKINILQWVLNNNEDEKNRH